jgi:magnesium chelatase subunit D
MKAPASEPAHKPERSRTARHVYPFAAIVGQEEMKLALLLNVIDSSIGGVLIMGHRGTGKSTIVRALADLLPQIWRASRCLYGCDPQDAANLCVDCEINFSRDGKLRRERGRVCVVNLPLGATEDRVCGTINLERAIKEGVKAFDPGLLARAHRGFLYIDEVNLLEDHLIDLLLDVAVTGRNSVEREGISVEHPSQFVLIGSGNPEEGELRPQLLDRFGLHVEIKTVVDVEQRVSIVELREAFERDPAGFRSSVENQQEALRRRITRARKNLQQVEVPRALLRQIAELCLRLNIDGHRGELTIARAARALAAFDGRKRVTEEDVRRVATLALRHRLRRDPFEPTDSGARVQQQLEELLSGTNKENERHAGDQINQAQQSLSEDNQSVSQDSSSPYSSSSSTSHDSASRNEEKTARSAGEKNSSQSNQRQDEQQIFPTLDARLPPETTGQSSEASDNQNAGRQNLTRHSARHQKGATRALPGATRGRYVRPVATKATGARLALDATLRAAAMHAGAESVWQKGNRAWAIGVREKRSRFAFSSSSTVAIAPGDLRYKSFRQKRGTLFIFAIDTSGSMAANRIGQAKGALARVLRQAYVRRDRVALVSFRQQRAEVLMPPSQSVTRARRILDSLPVGGSTPLAAGIACALEIAERAARQKAERICLLLFTDGRSNVSLRAQDFSERATRQRLIDEELEGLGAALKQSGVETIVVDTQNHFTSRDEGRALSNRLHARYVYLPQSVAFEKGIDELEALIERGRNVSKRIEG